MAATNTLDADMEELDELSAELVETFVFIGDSARAAISVQENESYKKTVYLAAKAVNDPQVLATVMQGIEQRKDIYSEGIKKVKETPQYKAALLKKQEAESDR